MMYRAFEFQARMFEPVRDAAKMALAAFGPGLEATDSRLGREMMATWTMVAHAGFTHARPDYGIRTVMVGNREVAVTEEVTHRTPFGTLLHFRKDTDVVQPKVLLVAPLSGHFATLLRNTAKTLLQDHDVFITDWHSARDIPGRPGASASTNMSSTSSTSCMCWDPAPTSSRCASPACRRWWRPR